MAWHKVPTDNMSERYENGSGDAVEYKGSSIGDVGLSVVDPFLSVLEELASPVNLLYGLGELVDDAWQTATIANRRDYLIQQELDRLQKTGQIDSKQRKELWKKHQTK